MKENKIFFNDKKLSYFVTHSANTKKISVTVNSELNIIVKAPTYVSKKYIEDFIINNYAKINKIINKKKISNFFNLYTNVISIKGIEYKLNLVQIVNKESNDRFKIEENNIFLYLKDLNNKEKILRRILKKFALEYVVPRTNFIANKLNLIVDKVDVKWLNATWGICHKRSKSISFSSKLIVFDPYVIDYVIVHELIHLVEPNHSKNFWDLVLKIMPDYKLRKNLLKEF